MSDKKANFFQTLKYKLSNCDLFGIKKRQIRNESKKSTPEFRQYLKREVVFLQSPDGLRFTGVAHLADLIKHAKHFHIYQGYYVSFGALGYEYELDLNENTVYFHQNHRRKKCFTYMPEQRWFILATVATKNKEDKLKQEQLRTAHYEAQKEARRLELLKNQNTK